MLKKEQKTKEEIDTLKNDNVWRTKDVADFIGKSQTTVRWMVHMGKLPCKKVGGSLVFSELAIRSLYLS